MPDSTAFQRVFVTGANGFIGRLLCEHFQAAGAHSCGVDFRADPARDIVAGDITRPERWQAAMKGCDLVIHAAAKVGMAGSAEDYWRANVLGTRRVLDAAIAAGVSRFVHLASIVSFGFDYPDRVAEDHPLRPNGVPYVDTKIASEHAVLQSHGRGDLDCRIVRPGDVYGPGSHFWTVSAIREIRAGRLLLPDRGRGQLSPVYVDDLVRGIGLAAAVDAARGNIYTITGGITVNTAEFYTHYARMVGKRTVPTAPRWFARLLAATVGPLMNPDISSAAVDYISRRGGYSIDKARRELGYEPQVSLEQGMERIAAWLQTQEGQSACG